MKHREFYLQNVVLLLKNQMQLPIQLEENDEETLYITDSGEVARTLMAQGQAVLGYCHEGNPQEDFSGVAYLVEDLEEVEPAYLERVYRRYKGIPWYILETEHCYVRESCVEDVEIFYQIYSDPAVNRYIEGLYENPAEEKEYMQAYIEHMYRYYEYGIWTVIEKSNDEIIGRAGIDLQEDREIPELGYIFAAKWRGKGLAEEVCRACIAYAKEVLGLDILQVHIQTGNMASLRLAQKLGFEWIERILQNDTMYEVLQREV